MRPPLFDQQADEIPHASQLTPNSMVFQKPFPTKRIGHRRFLRILLAKEAKSAA